MKVARYTAMDCLDLAIERYTPGEMTADDDLEFVETTFKFARSLKDMLEMAWEDIDDFIEEEEEDEEDDDIDEEGESAERENPFRQDLW